MPVRLESACLYLYSEILVIMIISLGCLCRSPAGSIRAIAVCHIVMASNLVLQKNKVLGICLDFLEQIGKWNLLY